MRTFDTGATRDTAEGKPNYGGYLSSLALRCFGRYMLKHETQADGKKREPGNWKKGIPERVYYESLLHHTLEDLMALMDGLPAREPSTTKKEALCAILFNAQGMLHEILKQELEAVSNPGQSAARTPKRSRQ